MREENGRVQKTICAEWVEKLQQTLDIPFADMRVHMHHRLVQRLAYPIESASNSKEMVKAFDDVLEGESSSLDLRPAVLKFVFSY